MSFVLVLKVCETILWCVYVCFVFVLKQKCGGAYGLAKILRRLAKTRRRYVVYNYLVEIIIFGHETFLRLSPGVFEAVPVATMLLKKEQRPNLLSWL